MTFYRDAFKRLKFASYLVIGSSSYSSLALAQGPSFDCTKAETKDEVAICANAELSALESSYSAEYTLARQSQNGDGARIVAKAILQKRRDCGSDHGCIYGVLTEGNNRLGTLRGADRDLMVTPSASDGMPVKLGECATSKIVDIKARLGGGDFQTGTEVRYQNGGFQVSYSEETSVIKSSIGDPVRICLVGLPEDCPEGDIRGRRYHTTNLRTNDSWLMLNAQHLCGGA